MGCAAGGLWFYPHLDIVRKRRKLKFFYTSHVKYVIIKHSAAFCEQFVLSKKQVKNTHFSQKLALLNATYDVISSKHGYRFSPTLTKLMSKCV